METTPGGTLARCSSIALELANHPLVRDQGTALLVTHGCPSTHSKQRELLNRSIVDSR